MSAFLKLLFGSLAFFDPATLVDLVEVRQDDRKDGRQIWDHIQELGRELGLGFHRGSQRSRGTEQKRDQSGSQRRTVCHVLSRQTDVASSAGHSLHEEGDPGHGQEGTCQTGEQTAEQEGDITDFCDGDTDRFRSHRVFTHLSIKQE